MKLQLRKFAVPKEQGCVKIDLFSNQPLWGRNKAQGLLDILTHSERPFLFQKWSRLNRKGTSFTKERKEEFLLDWDPWWWWDIDLETGRKHTSVTFHTIDMERSKPPCYSFSIHLMCGRPDDIHIPIRLWFYNAKASLSDESIQKQVIALVRDLCSWATVDFGRIQYFPTGEWVPQNEEEYQQLWQGLTKIHGEILVHRNLFENIPDVYAVTIWGKPYIDLFGREKLLKAPCYRVEELPSGVIWMQLGSHVFDARALEPLAEVRKAVKAYLNQDVFYNPDYPVDPNAHLRALYYDKDQPDPWARLKKAREFFKEMGRPYAHLEGLEHAPILPDHQYTVPAFDLSAIRQPIDLPRPAVEEKKQP